MLSILIFYICDACYQVSRAADHRRTFDDHTDRWSLLAQEKRALLITFTITVGCTHRMGENIAVDVGMAM
jgi:hypothetical protein